MKKILNLSGVQKLSKQEQRQLKGGRTSISCCPTGRGCQISFPGGSFCEPGRCNPFGWGGCILY